MMPLGGRAAPKLHFASKMKKASLKRLGLLLAAAAAAAMAGLSIQQRNDSPGSRDSKSSQAAAGAPLPHERGRELVNHTAALFHDIASRSLPAVVSITTIKSVEGRLRRPQNPADARMLGIGSGMFIRADGTILTSNHVVENAERIQV